MTTPLIQIPAPGQQLAEAVTNIWAIRKAVMDAAMERANNAEELVRRRRYLELAELREQNSQRMEAANIAHAKARLALEQEDTAINRANSLRMQRQVDLAARRQALIDTTMGLPENFYVDPEVRAAMVSARQNKAFTAGVDPRVVRVNAATRAAETPDLVALTAEAVRRSRGGPRPQPGTAGGVTYFPEAQSASFMGWNTGGAGRVPTTQDRLMRAAITGAVRQMENMERLEARDPTASIMPGTAAAIEGAGNIPVVGGALRGALEPVAQQAMTPNQQRWRAMLREFIHTYGSSLPGRRLGPELLKMLEPAFAPRAGQYDPSVLAQLRERRREAAMRMYRAAQGEAIDLESVLPDELRATLENFGAQSPEATGMESPTPGTNQRRTIDPRFLGP